MRWIEPRPPRLPLPTVLPTRCFRCPWTLPDGVGCRWTGPGQPTGLAVAARRRYSGTGRERVTQHGWTAMDTCGTNRTQPAESMRWGAGRTQKNRRTDTGGAARLEIAWHEPGVSGSYHRTLGNAQQREREPDAVAPNPPSPVTPPGLSGTMGLPSPDAADTDAGRRRPAGPARAATAQSTAALAPAPAPAQAPRSRSPRPA